MTGRSRPQELGVRELALYKLYKDCQLGMSPRDFYAKWNVTHAQMAQICGCSVTTVDRWFVTSSLQSLPNRNHLRKLAEMDLLWECYEQIPLELRQRLCPPATRAD